jgi:hypothetical protein
MLLLSERGRFDSSLPSDEYLEGFKEARRMPTKICGWFTEGFDTADLQEAKALLEELGHCWKIGSLKQ